MYVSYVFLPKNLQPVFCDGYDNAHSYRLNYESPNHRMKPRFIQRESNRVNIVTDWVLVQSEVLSVNMDAIIKQKTKKRNSFMNLEHTFKGSQNQATARAHWKRRLNRTICDPKPQVYNSQIWCQIHNTRNKISLNSFAIS